MRRATPGKLLTNCSKPSGWSHLTRTGTSNSEFYTLNTIHRISPKIVFEHGLAQVPDSAWLWLGLGLSQHLGDDTTRAQESVQKALTLDPGLVEGYARRSLICISVTTYCAKVALEAGESQTQEALAFLTKAIELNPDFAEAHFERGRILAQSDKLQQAVAEYNTSLAKNRSLSQAHYRLALLYRKLGQTRIAENEFALFQKTKDQEKDASSIGLEYRILRP